MHRPDSRHHRLSDRHLLLGGIQLGIGLLFLMSFVVFAVWGRFPVPYRDDWDWLQAHLTRPFTVTGLFEPHNEHMIPLPRVLFAIQYGVEGAAFRLSFVAALATQLLVGWLFWLQIRARWPDDRGMRFFAWGLSAVCLFVTYQLQSIVFVAAILFPLVQAFVVLACHAASIASAGTGAGETPAEPRRNRRWITAIAAVLGAALTTTNGLVAPWTVALFGLTNPRRTPRWALAVLLFLQLLCAFAYIVFVGRPWERAPTAPGQGWSYTSIPAIVEFFLSFFSSGLIYGGRAIGVGLGAVVFAAGCWSLWLALRDGPMRPAIERFACGLMLFTMASAAMTTIGRAQFGVIQAAQSRYATYTLVYWAALIVFMLSRMDAKARSRSYAPMMTAAAALTACALVVQVFVGLVWIAKKQNLEVAALTLATGVDDEQWVSTLHPIVAVVYRTRALLLADGKWTLADGRVGTRPALPVSRCDGEISLSAAAGGPGWRVDGIVRTPTREALIVDRDGIATGLATLAPAVAIPNPSQMDVVHAVWQRLTGSVPEADRWVGLSRTGGGAPYTLIVLDGSGGAECQLLVSVR